MCWDTIIGTLSSIAKAWEEMKKANDVHALATIGVEYFGDDLADHYGSERILSIEDLMEFIESASP